MSLDDLKTNSLYVILFIRGDPPHKDDFHWGLYLHKDKDIGGTKYHIKSLNSGWIADHGPTSGVFKSFLLVGLFRIADNPHGWERHIDQTIRTYDDRINVPGMTCTVWVLWIFKLLQRESKGYAVLKCNDLDALEREIKDWGNSQAQAAADCEVPRSLVASRICGLQE